jgi:hypothetical protein
MHMANNDTRTLYEKRFALEKKVRANNVEGVFFTHAMGLSTYNTGTACLICYRNDVDGCLEIWSGSALCHPFDRFDRKIGRGVAYRKALEEVNLYWLKETSRRVKHEAGQYIRDHRISLGKVSRKRSK